MDLPKRLIMAAIEMLRGQLYLLFFHHMHKRVHRFVESEWFDPVWRVHQLAFSQIEELAAIREIWLQARNSIRRPIGGHVEGPDKRDIFSFRGKTGGGRNQPGQGRGGRRGRAGGADPEHEDGDWTLSGVDALDGDDAGESAMAGGDATT